MEPTAAPSLRDRLRRAVEEGLERNIRRFLRFRGTRPGEPVELQALGLPGRFPENRFAHACTEDEAVELAKLADRFFAKGVYFIFNAIDPAVATRAAPGKWHTAKKNESTTDAEIRRRLCLFVDVDVRRPKETSATDDELEAALETGGRVFSALAELLGSESALGLGHSGNGAAVLIALADLDESVELAATVKGARRVAGAARDGGRRDRRRGQRREAALPGVGHDQAEGRVEHLGAAASADGVRLLR